MPDTAIIYEDVEVLEQDDLGMTCRIGNERVFVGKYVPAHGTTVYRKGDRGRLALPRWFVEQEQLQQPRHQVDREVEDRAAKAELSASAAREYADARPDDAAVRNALERARAELYAALVARRRRHQPD